MRPFHVITGLPRAGSTLLAAMYDQRPETYVSATSDLPSVISGLSGIFEGPTEKAKLIKEDGTADHHKWYLGQCADTFHHQGEDADVIIDKSRSWSLMSVALRAFAPDAGMIVAVRDPRDVAASIERHHRATGQYQGHVTLEDRLEAQFNRQAGLIGAPLRGVMDLVNRNVPGVAFVKFERFVVDPKGELAELDKMLGLEPFEYNMTDFHYESNDVDALYMLKFPHVVDGPVQAPEGSWEDVFSKPVADKILASCPDYCELFRYS
jgi:sulfotransferase